MKTLTRTFISTLVIASIAGLTACGGGGDSSSSTNRTDGTEKNAYVIQSKNISLDDIQPNTQLNLVKTVQSNLNFNSKSDNPVYRFENNPLGDYLTISTDGLVTLHTEKNHTQFLHKKIIINALLDNKKVADISLDVSHRNLTFMVLDTKYQKDGGPAVYKSVDSLNITPGDDDMVYIKNTSNQPLNLKDNTDFTPFNRGFYFASINNFNPRGYTVEADSFFPEPNFDFKFQLIRNEIDDNNPKNKKGIDCYNQQVQPRKICRLRYIAYPLDIPGPIEYNQSGDPLKSWAWMGNGIPGRLISFQPSAHDDATFESTPASFFLWSESLRKSATSSGIKGDFLKDKKGLLHIDTDRSEIKTDLQITLNNHNIKHIELPAYDNNTQPTNTAIIDKLTQHYYKDGTFEGLDIIYPNNYQKIQHKLPVVILNHGAWGVHDVVGVYDWEHSKGGVAYKHSLMQLAEKIAQKGMIVLMPLIQNDGDYYILSNYQSYVDHALINELASGDFQKLLSDKTNDIQISPYFYYMRSIDLKDLFDHADLNEFGLVGLSSGAKASLQAASSNKSYKRHDLIKAVIALSDGYTDGAGLKFPHPEYNISNIPTLFEGGALDDKIGNINYAFSHRNQKNDILLIEKNGWHQTAVEDINMNELNATFLSAYLNHSQVDYDKIYGSTDGSIKDVCHKKRVNDDFGQRINNSIITMDLDGCNIRK